MKVIFDIGANDGFNGLVFAALNPNTKVFSFEPNPNLKKLIFKNKKIFEKVLNIKLKNFILIKKAVSNKKGKSIFYITNNHATSSLLEPKKKLDKFWTNNKDSSIQKVTEWIKVKKRVKVDTIKLKDFCQKQKINIISYIHCDTQGHDLQVFEGLGNFRRNVYQGVLEISTKIHLSLYKNTSDLKILKKNFKKWNYNIKLIEEFHKNNPERNIYFSNSNFVDKVNLNLPSKSQLRFFKRILSSKLKIKDYIFILVHKVFYA